MDESERRYCAVWLAYARIKIRSRHFHLQIQLVETLRDCTKTGIGRSRAFSKVFASGIHRLRPINGQSVSSRCSRFFCPIVYTLSGSGTSSAKDVESSIVFHSTDEVEFRSALLVAQSPYGFNSIVFVTLAFLAASVEWAVFCSCPDNG